MKEKSFQNIREYFAPSQPTIRGGDKLVNYTEFLPHQLLQPYIYCYWELKTIDKLTEPFFYRVVADGCIDIYFDLNLLSESYIMGFCKKYTEFPLENSFHYVGIRFLPAMFSNLFQVNAAGLSHRYQLLENVVPTLSNFIETSFRYGDTMVKRGKILDEFFIEIVSNIDNNFDQRLYKNLAFILKSNGVLVVEEAVDFGISQRQLGRLFEYYIGTNIKTFCKVVQFQNILRAKPSTQSLRKNKLFYDFGYYDQSHFIKDFKNFCGITPSKFFNR